MFSLLMTRVSLAMLCVQPLLFSWPWLLVSARQTHPLCTLNFSVASDSWLVATAPDLEFGKVKLAQDVFPQLHHLTNPQPAGNIPPSALSGQPTSSPSGQPTGPSHWLTGPSDQLTGESHWQLKLVHLIEAATKSWQWKDNWTLHTSTVVQPSSNYLLAWVAHWTEFMQAGTHSATNQRQPRIVGGLSTGTQKRVPAIPSQGYCHWPLIMAPVVPW